MPDAFSFDPIGYARTPYKDRVSAPRQPYAAAGTAGSIELVPGRDFEHALEDLEGWDRLWLVFVFHLNVGGGFRPKVLPPRSAGKRRGLFSTRSPHRPNPIGLSVVRLVAVHGLVLDVLDVDLVDGTPILDLKPYVPWADAFPSARTGWLTPLSHDDVTGETPRDPEPGFEVVFAPLVRAQLAWLAEVHGVDLELPITATLRLGPQPHPYRRIRRDGDAYRLAVKDWRVRFSVEGRAITVLALATGYRPRELALSEEPEVLVQRAFVARFGAGGEP